MGRARGWRRAAGPAPNPRDRQGDRRSSWQSMHGAPASAWSLEHQGEAARLAPAGATLERRDV